jgi:hypothetical protein
MVRISLSGYAVSDEHHFGGCQGSRSTFQVTCHAPLGLLSLPHSFGEFQLGKAENRVWLTLSPPCSWGSTQETP